MRSEPFDLLARDGHLGNANGVVALRLSTSVVAEPGTLSPLPFAPTDLQGSSSEAVGYMNR